MVHLVTALYSEDSMFRRFCVQKYLSKRFYVQKVLYSEGPMFRRSYVQKVPCSENMSSKGPLFRRFYVQKVLYSDMFGRSYIQKSFVLCWNKLTSFSFRQTVLQDNKPKPLILAHLSKGQMSFCHGGLSVVCPSTIFKNRYCVYFI